MKKKFLISLTGVFVLLISSGYLFLYPVLPFVPEIGRNLPSSDEFEKRVQERYPVGLKEEKIIQSLSQQGFKIKEKKNGKYAVFDKRSFPCMFSWRIFWQIDENRSLTGISSSFESACL